MQRQPGQIFDWEYEGTPEYEARMKAAGLDPYPTQKPRQMNEHEATARALKAARLVTQLDRLALAVNDATDPATLETMDEEFWERLALAAGVHKPSARTKELVLRMLADRQETPDPFAGFPA